MVNKPYKAITKKEQSFFKSQLKNAVVEKDVEVAYKAIFQKYYGVSFPSPYGSDGYIELAQRSLFDDELRLLLEVKYDLDLTQSKERAKIVAQAIYYLKRFEQDGKLLPSVILGGDENQMFTIYAPKLKSYLAEDYDWSIAPSSAWRDNENLYRKLLEDRNLNVYVFDIRSSAFDINNVFSSITSLNDNNEEFEKIRVSEANIRMVFDEFVRNVWGNDWLTGIKKLGATETVSVFIQSILGDPEIYLVPTKRNVLHLANGKEIHINASSYDAFFSHYDRKYSIREIDTITAVADQLIEEVRRRFHGDFWTPTIWANRAVEMIAHDLGEDWRDKYVVWDPAAGTKNLTRDYHFRKLFTSTLHQAEIDMSRQYNQEATSFQYDFLNDDVDVSPDSDPRDLKMPLELFEALKNNEPIIFYTNPPYGQATDQGFSSKDKIAETKIGAEMRAQGFGLASSELYTQFIYRVQKLSQSFNLSNVFFFFFFFNKGFLASPAFGKFTDQLLDQFRFNGGFMLNAGEFQGTSSAWGIIFSNFELKQQPLPRQTEFEFLVERSGENGIEKLTTHALRSVEKQDTVSAWLQEIPVSKEEYNGGQYPRITGGFNVPSGKNPCGSYKLGAIGFMHNNGQNVQFSDKYVNLNTTMNYADHGSTVTRDNFERVCVVFAARKSILPDASWINDKDIFRCPSEKFQASDKWPEFVTDSVVFSLFHRSSYQTSLRQFEYNDEYYDVYNEWFFMPKAEILDLAEKYDLRDIYNDARSADERFVYRYLQNRELSAEAMALLEAGRELVRATFTRRFIASEEHPEWHLKTWDAGYYQAYKITTMYKEEFAELMQRFDVARTALETKIRTQVYKDGILRQ